jgi:predicted enzyme related to lactoylglutathione lyase
MGNPISQWQMLAKDPEAAARFYTRLFDWKIERDNKLGYRQVRTGSGPDGGIWPAPPEGHNLVQLFIEVDDIDHCIAEAVALGARVIVPRSELPDGDALAVVVDPFGVPFGLHRRRPGA